MSKNADSGGSLFDLAKKMQKKKEAEPKKEGEELVSSQTTKGQILPTSFTQDERNAAFERMKRMHDEIQNKIESAYEDAKISPRQVKSYIENPTHFAAKDWDAIQKTKNELKGKLEKLVPSTVARAAEETSGESEKEKLKKAKGGIVSRKRWLSTH